MCQEVANRYEACSTITFQTTLQFMQCMGLTNWPIFSCPVEITLVQEQVSFVAATIIGGVATPTNITVTPIGQYAITINGNPCVTDSILTVAFNDITPIERAQICDTTIPCIQNPITFDDFILCLSQQTFPNISTIANIALFNPSFGGAAIAEIVNGVFSPIPVPIALPAGLYVILINEVPCDPVLAVNISV
jgi:hypothetical protein